MARPKMREPRDGNNVSSSFLVSNMHCHSCVSVIRSALREICGEDALWISPNIITSIVTVEHKDTERASVRTMFKSLDEAGFEVCEVWTTSTVNPTPDQPNHALPSDQSAAALAIGRLKKSVTSLSMARKTAHVVNCDQCRSSAPCFTSAPKADSSGANLTLASGKVGTTTTYSAIKASRPSDDLQITCPPPSQAAAVITAAATAADKTGVELETVITTPSMGPLWRVIVAIGGMTCASCVNIITEEVLHKPWVDKVTVNLISNSATVDLYDMSQAEAVAESIRDLGFDATVDRVFNLEEQSREQDQQKRDRLLPAGHERVCEIKIDGLFCSHCPARIAEVLKWFSGRLEVLSGPTLQTPIVKIRYHPSPPEFTVRQILAAIEATDPSFRVSVHHPPTIEERSKAIQAKHQRALLWRVILTVAATVPTFILGIVYMDLLPASNPSRQFLVAPWASGVSRVEIALFILATPVYLFAADIFHVRAFKETRVLWRRGSPIPVLQRFYRFGSMNTLMSLGTTIAYLSSLGEMIATAASGPGADNQDSNMYFDSVVFLTLFLLVGKLMESYSKSKTGDAVEQLARLRPTTATLVEQRDVSPIGSVGDSGEREKEEHCSVVPADVLEVGDVVRVPHGASPPADGTLVGGTTTFDESSLTGESRPIEKAVGDEVFAGTVNKGGPVLIRVAGVGGASMLDQIVNVVREGQTKRAPMERLADVLTAYFAPLVTVIAILTWIVWLALSLSGAVQTTQQGSGARVVFALQFAVAVFVVACPCGLGLAAPTAIFVGGGIAAQHGILAKGGGEAFENASRIDCIVFDKTGTLTAGGEPRVADAVFFPDRDGNEHDLNRGGLMRALQAVEAESSHPIAKAVLRHCSSTEETTHQEGLQGARVSDVQEQVGKGMQAKCLLPATGQEFEVLCGNERLMEEHSVHLSSRVLDLLATWKAEAKSVVLAAQRRTRIIASDDDRQEAKGMDEPWELVAALSVTDPARPEAAAVVSNLKRRGISVWMLSGDNAVTARAVAARLGIDADRVMAGVLPSEKADRIRQLQAAEVTTRGSRHRRATVAMVGDGINDSPALAAADVGVAVGSGSDVAIASADFILVASDLRAVLTLLSLSRAVFHRVRLNFGWAICYNAIAVPIAAGALYAVHSSAGQPVRLDPAWAALAMALSSISVVLSSLALRLRVPGIGFRAPSV